MAGRTTAAELRHALLTQVPRNEWVELTRIYELIEKGLQLSPDDWAPPADYAQADSKWKRDLRTVIKRLADANTIRWDKSGQYLIPASLQAEASAPGRRYWALLANPKEYDIERAVAERPTDVWVTRGRGIRRGDRGLIWKADGGSGRRGAIALFEAQSDPEERPDEANPYWTDQARAKGAASQPEPRVDVTYLTPAGLPLWLPNPVLDDLGVARARGGTVFELSEVQWRAVLAAAGGWSASEERQAAVRIARPRQRRAGRIISAELRRAIELHAVQVATAHFTKQGWTVEDVGDRESFDLLCRRAQDELHVEVKGTMGKGEAFVLTRNEVAHALRQYPNVALACVSEIELVVEDPTQLRGGSLKVFHPWNIEEFALEALTYELALPIDGPH